MNKRVDESTNDITLTIMILYSNNYNKNDDDDDDGTFNRYITEILQKKKRVRLVQ